MRVTTVIPAFGAEAFLERSVDSLLATGYRDLEIVIVDDASTDGTRRIANVLEHRHPSVVTVIANSTRRGVSACRNLGISAASGDVLCFLDADDYVFPNRFESGLSLLADDPRIDGVYGRTVMRFEAPGARIAWAEETESFGLSSAVPHQQLLETLLEGHCWHTGGVLCRRGLIERVGGFDERMRIAEDCNLWFRMAAGGRMVGGSMDAPVSAYVRHTSNTYSHRIEHKIDMLVAMARAARWARTTNVSSSVREVFARTIRNYLWNAVVVAREAGRTDIAWKLIGTALRERSAASLANGRMARQLARLMIVRSTTGSTKDAS